MMDISTALIALEQLASSTSTSSSGPLNVLLDEHFSGARQRLLAGEDPKTVIGDLQKSVVRSKKEVEKGLKAWYAALGNVGKSIEKVSTRRRRDATRYTLADSPGVPAEPRGDLVGVR
jgi:hypothetical protein